MFYLYKKIAVTALRLGNLATARLLPAACAMPAACAKPAFSLELSLKPTFLASWRPRRLPDGPAGAPDSLRTGLLVPKTASGPPQMASDGPPGAPDGLRTVLLAPKTTSGRASWRPRRPPDGPPGAKRAFDAFAFLSVLQRLHDDFLCETSVRSTQLQINFVFC